MELPEQYDRTDIREFTLIPMMARGIRGMIQDIQELRGKALSKKVEKTQKLVPKKILKDILGDGENFLKNFYNFPIDQITNAISEVLSHWTDINLNGYDSQQVFENLKRYLGEILKSEDGRKAMFLSGIFVGEIENGDGICIEEIEGRVRAQGNLKELFKYGTSGKPENPISFELIKKLGPVNKVKFFEGTNTEKLSQFDFVVMGLFDAIRREVVIAHKRKIQKTNYHHRINDSRDFDEKEDLMNLNDGFILKSSEIAQKNMQYYIGVLQLLLSFANENGCGKFSQNVGEYFSRIFRDIEDINITVDTHDLVHELGQARVQIEKAFNVEQVMPEDLPENVIPLHQRTTSS